MAFVGEKVTSEKDKEYIRKIGFKYVSGNPIESVRRWAVDRENEYVFVSRGGGGLEMPEGYALYVDGEIVDIEGSGKVMGTAEGADIKIHWSISKIEVNKSWFDKEKDYERLSEIVKEAFTAFSYINRNPSHIIEIVVEINAKAVNKINSRGEEV